MEARFYHAQTAERNALLEKQLRTFVYLDTTGSPETTVFGPDKVFRRDTVCWSSDFALAVAENLTDRVDLIAASSRELCDEIVDVLSHGKD